jgi:hypothetical protein
VYSSRTYFLMSYIKSLTASETTQHRLVKILANNKLKTVWKPFWPNLRLYPGINLDSMKEGVRNLRQGSRCLQNDSIQTAGKYQLQSLPLQSTFLVLNTTNVHIWDIKRGTCTGVVKLTTVNLPRWRTNPFQDRLLLLEYISQAIPMLELSSTLCSGDL